MFSRIISLTRNKVLPRWYIFLIDLVICSFAFTLSFLLRFNFSVSEKSFTVFLIQLFFILGLNAFFFYLFKPYKSIIRYSSTHDAIKIVSSVFCANLAAGFLNVISFFLRQQVIIPTSILMIDFFITIVALISSRLIYKTMYKHLTHIDSKPVNVVIYGAGQSAIITKRTLDNDTSRKYNVVGFIDDDKQKAGKTIEGTPIFYSENSLPELIRKFEVEQMIISIQNISISRKKEIIEKALSNNLKVKNVPPPDKWINGELSFKQIKGVKIEDLLNRDPIQLDKAAISNQLNNKVILITGAAGSIGSEMVRQILQFQPEKVLLLDQSETALFELENELKSKYNHVKAEIIVGDIRNYDRVEKVFKVFHPEFVFHAAAYKHVPLMENNPAEAVLTNVMGTKNMADLAVKYRVKKFVMVSTDKAVNPTNIMGASKRIAEIYVQSLNFSPLVGLDSSGTKFITTRFGNVLGSNGSVIPMFTKQIAEGGPITVTHPDVTRYFMTIPEACQLVLEAGSMGKGGEIYIFDMGESVRIIDLAKKMIKLSGLKLGKDIQIVFTGLRPGEKIKEELLNDAENTQPTYHPKIMIAKVQPQDYDRVSKEMEALRILIQKQSNVELVSKMKQIVPEYKSNNSIYEELDSLSTIA